MTEDLDDNLIQFLIDQLNQGYAEYKKNHPDFAKVVEQQLEGKTEEQFEAQFIKKKTHCKTCGEWLENFELCSQCGRINK
jgi:hypothetical protein